MKKRIILGTSDAWLTSELHCRLSDFKNVLKQAYVIIKCSLMYSQLPASTVLLTLSGGTDTEQIQKSKEMHFCNHLCPRELDSCLDLSSVTD